MALLAADFAEQKTATTIRFLRTKSARVVYFLIVAVHLQGGSLQQPMGSGAESITTAATKPNRRETRQPNRRFRDRAIQSWYALIPSDQIGRINLLRILLGLVLLDRYTTNASAVFAAGATSREQVVVVFVLVAASCLTVGLLTPFAATALFLYQWQADATLSTWSLASMILQMVLIVMALLPAGSRISIDSLVISRTPAWRLIFRPWGEPSPQRAVILRFVAFVSYAVISWSAVYHHFINPRWTEGLAQLYVFGNAYLSRHPDVMRELIGGWPALALLISQAATFLMLAWESLMLPMVLSSRIGAQLVAWYGASFFVVSATLMQLGWLPYFELILWALVFWVSAAPRFPMKFPRVDWRLAMVVALYLIGVSGAIAALPFVGSRNSNPRISAYFGMSAVDVFNDADIASNQSYATISRVQPDGSLELLPFNGPDGRRLAWHKSERVLYGLSVNWRRLRAGHGRECWNDGLDRPWVDGVIRLDRGRGASADSHYVLSFYAERLPDFDEARQGQFASIKPMLQCRVAYDGNRAQRLE